jgi:hypothetical protein
LFWVEIALLVLMLAVVVTPLALSWGKPNFFETPFVTWWLLHSGIGALAILALVALAFAGSLTAPVIAIFSGLFGFIFGSTASRAAAAATAGTKTLAISGVEPATAASGRLVKITGQGIDQRATAKLGASPLDDVAVSADGGFLTGHVGQGTGTVDVVVQNPDGSTKTLVAGFTFETPE